MSRRIVLAIVLAIVLGGATAAVVACIGAVVPGAERVVPGAGPVLRAADGSHWMGWCRQGLARQRVMAWPAPGVTPHGEAIATPTPPWFVPPDEPVAGNEVIEALGTGWPFVCLRAVRRGRDDTAAQAAATGVMTTGLGPAVVSWDPWIGALAASESATTRGSPRVVPWRPAWRGLLANAALFAAAWLLVLHVGVVRRAVRRRRGACSACGYRLVGNAPLDNARTCPECGHVAPPRR